MIVAVNKVDNLKPSHIITQMKAAAALGDFHALHPVSAKTKDGIEELRADLVHLLPAGQPHFPREVATDQTAEERLAELIREKALQLTRDEVPHSISRSSSTSSTRSFAGVRARRDRASKQILVGKKGAMIREIGTRARPEIEALLGHKVFLELVVKVFEVAPRRRGSRAAWALVERGSSRTGPSILDVEPSCASSSVSIATSFPCACSGPASSLTGQAFRSDQRITS